jgi:hypothetical protein
MGTITPKYGNYYTKVWELLSQNMGLLIESVHETFQLIAVSHGITALDLVTNFDYCNKISIAVAFNQWMQSVY